MNRLEGHILIVDDIPSNREVLARLLHKDGLTTEEAEDGFGALEKLRAGTFDTVLLDVMMPGMDGLQTLAVLKEEASFRDVPVIMLSAQQDARIVRQCIEMGADDYLSKPIDSLLLRARLTACLRRKQFQDREKEYLLRLESTNEELRRLNQFKSRVLAVAAHDLKNPMTTMLLLMDQNLVTEDGTLNLSRWRKSNQHLRDSIQKMMGILQALLDSAAFEAGHYILQKRPTDLASLARAVIEENAAYAQSKAITLSLSAPPAVDWSLLADPTRIREAIDNLVGNAIKFSPPGTGVQVSLEGGLREGRPVGALRVRDQGPGLTDQDLQKVFGIYQRLSAIPTGGELSTGLGLSIVKQMVELHGGRVWVESHRPGATFGLELPLGGT